MDQQTAIIGAIVCATTALGQVTSHFRNKQRAKATEEVKQDLKVIGYNVDGNLSKALTEIVELKQSNIDLKKTVSGLEKVVEKLLERNGGHMDGGK